MFPHLFTIGGYSQSTYGLLVAVAFVVAITLTGRFAKQAGLSQEAVMNLGMYCALAGIVGAKFLMFTHISSVGEIFTIETLRAGGDFFGGLILALIVAEVYMRKKGLVPPTADVFAPGVALGHGIGRLGCFAAGCCYGIRTHLLWPVTFTDPDSNGAPLHVPIHPTQLYEALAEARSSPSCSGASASRAPPGNHQPLPGALRYGALPGGIRALPRTRRPAGRPAGHLAMDRAGADGARGGLAVEGT
jgi:phosphatidylglycerol---prolipoprotein diacylglyceryl transferase